ncbi:hypothetical protein HDV06_005116 [Boothiomyces sp. JEL0866]|nr:hypothetical protein HDV06_005116 [Boothiomyces sp. JEL0866]
MSTAPAPLVLEDYLDRYTALCQKKKIPIVNCLVKRIKDAIENGDTFDDFYLKGTYPDLRLRRISDDMAESIISSLHGLEFLKVIDLSYNEIGDKGATDTLLEVLMLQSNNLGAAGIAAICKSLQYNTQITYLDLSNNEITDEAGLAIASMLQINTGITNLFLSGCKLQATSLIAITTVLQTNNYIQQLDISNNILSTGSLSQTLLNDVMTHLSIAITNNYGIKNLNISKMGITDYIMCNMLASAFQLNSNIETLNLSGNRITRDGGVALCKALAFHQSINNLKLSCCAIQNEGAEAVAQLLLTNTKLKELYLDYNKITGPGLVAISKGLEANVMLKYIAVWGNSWDAASCEAFAKLLGGPSSVVKIENPKAHVEIDKNPRLVQGNIDVTFCRVQQVLQVARYTRDDADDK